MRIAFPVQHDLGIESIVYNHFGSAPVFLIVDGETSDISPVANRDQQHEHGACNPMRALDGWQVDTVIVGSIGGGALAGLNRMGITVHRSAARTIRENMALLAAGALAIIGLQGTCAGHGKDGGCAH